MTESGSAARRIVIDLEPSRDSIRGWVHGDRSERRDFQGWLELSALLDMLRPRQIAADPGAEQMTNRPGEGLEVDPPVQDTGGSTSGHPDAAAPIRYLGFPPVASGVGATEADG